MTDTQGSAAPPQDEPVPTPAESAAAHGQAILKDGTMVDARLVEHAGVE